MEVLPITNNQLEIGNIGIGNISTLATWIMGMWHREIAEISSRPCRRAVNRAAMSADGNCFRQLALCRQSVRNVPAIRGMKSKVCRALARVEHDNLFPELAPDNVKRCDEVRIAGDDGKCFGGACVGIAEDRSGEVYISPLLFNFYHMDKAVCGVGARLATWIYRRDPRLVLVVVAFDDIDPAMCGDGLKVDVLAFDCGRVVRICLGPGAEILDGNEFVVRVKLGMDEHCSDKCGKVEPFAGWKSAKQSVVKIAAVNICYCFHCIPIKKKRGSQAFRPKTPFRVGRALRLDKNLLIGSVHILSNFRLPHNGTSWDCRGEIKTGLVVVIKTGLFL